VNIEIRIIESPQDLEAVEELQRLIWSGNDVDLVPVHVFCAMVQNGGLVIGAYNGDQLVGFVFGFLGTDTKKKNIQIIHVSHMAGVHPEFRDYGLGYKLKRAQWQMVRNQKIDRIIWTFDPLQSRNANLNIAKLGAVSNTYYPNYYGEMRDEINRGMPSDRFRVDWWVNSNRVINRLSSMTTPRLDLAHYLEAEIPFANSTEVNDTGLAAPIVLETHKLNDPLLLVEIPAEIQKIKNASPDLAYEWRSHVRKLFVDLFAIGYLVTDFIYLPGSLPRSFYVLSHGEATL